MRQCVCVSEVRGRLKQLYQGSFDQCREYLVSNRSKYPDMQIYTLDAFKDMQNRKARQ